MRRTEAARTPLIERTTSPSRSNDRSSAESDDLRFTMSTPSSRLDSTPINRASADRDHPYSFDVVTRDRTYNLSSPSETDMISYAVWTMDGAIVWSYGPPRDRGRAFKRTPLTGRDPGVAATAAGGQQLGGASLPAHPLCWPALAGQRLNLCNFGSS